MEFEWALFGEMFLNTFTFWWIILPAIFLGLIVGAIPGFSAANTIIILLPLTIAMDPEVGLVFMVALYASSRLGAGIPAILVNIPGTAGAAATPLDGYPMTKQGRGQQALTISFVCSTLGGLLTTIIALLAMPWLSLVAYQLHSVEMIVVSSSFVPDSPLYFGNGGIERPLGGFSWTGGSDPSDPSTWSIAAIRTLFAFLHRSSLKNNTSADWLRRWRSWRPPPIRDRQDKKHESV